MKEIVFLCFVSDLHVKQHWCRFLAVLHLGISCGSIFKSITASWDKNVSLDEYESVDAIDLNPPDVNQDVDFIR